MRHKFVVVIDGNMTRNQAQHLLRDIGGFQGSLPVEEQLEDFEVTAYPIQNKPTLIMGRKA